MPSIFSRIVSGEIPCARVWEDERFLAFLESRRALYDIAEDEWVTFGMVEL